MANLDLYNSWREVPKNAQKTISGGNLNGKTDINPQWRIRVLTETFGPVGFGWYTNILEHWSDETNIDGKVECSAWVRVALFVKYNGEWSQPIEGIGGSKYAGKGRGSELNDEAFKMAETDAISVACKKLGIGADIYWDKDNTKYTQGGTAAPKYLPVTHPAQISWLRQKAAEGQTREWCEAKCNARGVTIPNKLWDDIITNL